MTAQNEQGAEAEASVTAIIIPPLPVGSVIAYACDPARVPPPPGWLLCDGSPFDNTKFPLLFAALGGTHLPDLRGYFLRGFDPTGRVDPQGASRAVLSTQEDAFRKHQHETYQAPWNDSEPYDTGTTYRSSYLYTNFRHMELSGATGDAETRPQNVAVNYLIYAGFVTSPPQAGEQG